MHRISAGGPCGRLALQKAQMGDDRTNFIIAYGTERRHPLRHKSVVNNTEEFAVRSRFLRRCMSNVGCVFAAAAIQAVAHSASAFKEFLPIAADDLLRGVSRI